MTRTGRCLREFVSYEISGDVIATTAEVWCEKRQPWVDLGLAMSLDRQ